MKRLRIGLGLIVLSWLPIAQVVLIIAHNHQHLMGEAASNEFRLVVWGIQILIGLVGVWLVGKLAVAAAKKDGWKKTPSNLWKLFRAGDSSEDKS